MQREEERGFIGRYMAAVAYEKMTFRELEAAKAYTKDKTEAHKRAVAALTQLLDPNADTHQMEFDTSDGADAGADKPEAEEGDWHVAGAQHPVGSENGSPPAPDPGTTDEERDDGEGTGAGGENVQRLLTAAGGAPKGRPTSSRSTRRSRGGRGQVDAEGGHS